MLCEFGRPVLFAFLNILLFHLNSSFSISVFTKRRCLGKFTSQKLGLLSSHSLQMSSFSVSDEDQQNSGVKNSLQLFVSRNANGAKLVPMDAVRVPNSVEVKSLIWEYNGCPLAVVLDESKQVDVTLLAEYCGVSVEEISLASPERAVQLGGTVSDIQCFYLYSDNLNYNHVKFPL
jgi:hypothetical protein